ncbi:putative hexose carrier protein [Botrytis fragariae]|uniref:Putative hexose carrier protein n=1 Tax=Botrytis fragariae TaxID=1964551 RepID=A0A8H6AWE9_9HELO|nr:putative hexose carrier protein [Botrytis fragariae]KAF5874827.1 putative hexose carrier protein [Botrytis fragariae]
MALGGAIFAFGCALQAGAANVGILIAGRAIAGIAVGILSALVPIFQWRFPLAFRVVPGLFLAIGTWFLQESPRWLMEKDRQDEAREALYKLHSDGSNDEYLELEFSEIRDTIIAEKTVAVKSWSELIAKKIMETSTNLGMRNPSMGLLGIDTRTSLMIIGISGSFSIVYCALDLYFLERLARVKPMVFLSHWLCIGSVGQHSSQSVLRCRRTTINKCKCIKGNGGHESCLLIFLYIYWNYQLGPPRRNFSRGNSISTLTNWCLDLLLGQTGPLALTNIGFKFFYVFFVFNILATACYWIFYPETKGKTLEQMDELFGDQLVPHALEDPTGAEAARAAMNEKGVFTHDEDIS